MDYYAPTALDDALDLLAPQTLDVVAGGTDFFPALPEGGAKHSLLDVTRIEGLRGISQDRGQDRGCVRIGAATRWSDIVHADLPACFDGLKQAARQVGSLQIQNAGTIAGNICNASPAADGVPPLLTLDAQVELTSKRGVRTLPLGRFLTGVRQTQRAGDELVTAILVPPMPAQACAAFDKLGSRSYLVISITMTAAVIGCDAEGRIDFARVAVGACSAVAQRLPALEADLLGRRPADTAVSREHLAPLSPITDVRGSAEFRLDVVAEQCLRTLHKAGQADG